MATLVNCFTIQGIDGYPVDIEIKTLEGQIIAKCSREYPKVCVNLQTDVR